MGDCQAREVAEPAFGHHFGCKHGREAWNHQSGER
jgi:hypothetical protein